MTENHCGGWPAFGIWPDQIPAYTPIRTELGETQHIVQISNRRFRDDEFLIPRELTEGRHAIRIRIQFTPVVRPLFPGYPVPELAWSELRYTAYSFVLP
jgi:hypothetical protein